MIQNTGFISN